MGGKTFDDFVRFIRNFCKERKVELKEDAKSGPHCGFSLIVKVNGKKIKIERFVLRCDKNDMKQSTLRRLLAHVKSNADKRVSTTSDQNAVTVLEDLVANLERWMKN